VQSSSDLSDNERRLSFLLKLSDALHVLTDPTAIQVEACRLIGEHLKVDCVRYGEIDGEEYIPRAAYAPANDVDLRRGPVSGLNSFLRDAYRRGEAVAIDDVAVERRFTADERTRLLAVGIAAFLGFMLLKNGQWVGALSLQHKTPRTWTPAEVELTREVAERVWAATERAKAQAAARESENRIRQFGEASSDVLWIRDAKTLRNESITPAFEKIFGFPRERAMADDHLTTWREVILPEDYKVVAAGLDAARRGERVTFEYRIRRPDGDMRWVRSTIFPILDADGKVSRLGGIAHDATEEKTSTARLQVLVSELQHRTRNLVAVIGALSNKTAQECTSLAEFQYVFGERLAAVGRAQAHLSRLADGEKVVFDELLRAELMSHAKSGRVTLAGPRDVPLRNSAVQTFALALHELTTNAVKYGALSRAEGHLEVRWELRPDAGGDQALHVDWRERGVDTAAVPTAAKGGGYGRELIERALPYQLQAKTSYELTADGVHCTITAAIAGISPAQLDEAAAS